MEEIRKVAEQNIQNQSGEMDFGRASAELAEVSAQLLTLQKFRKQMKGS